MDQNAAWSEIAHADDQVQRYFEWCSEVIAGQVGGKVSIADAAAMIAPREDAASFSQLSRDADVQMLMDYASDIADGAAYAGSEEALRQAWSKVTEIVSRHR